MVIIEKLSDKGIDTGGITVVPERSTLTKIRFYGSRESLLEKSQILLQADRGPREQLPEGVCEGLTEQALSSLRESCAIVLSDYDVVQPDILFVSNTRANILTEANIQGAPDLVVEILSPATAQHDREYKRTLYSRHGVREYWLVDPEEDVVEVWTESESGLVLAAAYQRGDTLASPLLEGLNIPLEPIFA